MIEFHKEIQIKDGRTVSVRNLKEGEDIQAFLNYVNELIDEDTFISLNKHLTYEEEKNFVESNLKSQKEGKSINLVSEYGGKVISVCSIRSLANKEDYNAELGISILKEYRGQGLGGRLMQELIDYAKQHIKPGRIFLRVYSTNECGLHLYEKVGFKKIAVLPKWIKHRGELVDTIYMEYQE